MDPHYFFTGISYFMRQCVGQTQTGTPYFAEDTDIVSMYATDCITLACFRAKMGDLCFATWQGAMTNDKVINTFNN